MQIPHFLIVAVYFLVILGVMVLIHEAGHFFVAKLFKVRVEAFSIGMGKRLFGVVHNGTDYKICALPFGGYVKMTGETEMEMIQTSPSESLNPSERDGEGAAPAIPNNSGGYIDSGNFNAKPRWQRMLIALAGPVANFILAILIFSFVARMHHESMVYLQERAEVDYVAKGSVASRSGVGSGDTIIHFDTVERPSWQDIEIRSTLNLNRTVPFSYIHNGQRVDTGLTLTFAGTPEEFRADALGLVPRAQDGPVIVADVPDGTSPAAVAGLRKGDLLLSVDGHPFHSTDATSTYLKDGGGRPVALQVRRDGATMSMTVQPRLVPVTGNQDRLKTGGQAYRLGFAAVPPPVTTEKLPWGQALTTGWKDFTKNSVLIFDVLRGMFTRHVSVRSLSGPVGIAQQVGLAQEMGSWTVLQLMAGISVNLGIFNLLPIPVLDGGMILFLLIESLIRRDVNAQVKERIYQAAFVCIMIFAVLVIFNDLTKLPIFTHKS